MSTTEVKVRLMTVPQPVWRLWPISDGTKVYVEPEMLVRWARVMVEWQTVQQEMEAAVRDEYGWVGGAEA